MKAIARLLKFLLHEYSSPLHWHKYLEILYIFRRQGPGVYKWKERIVEPGTLIFINTKEEHYTDFINHEKHKILCIQFDADILYTLGGIGHEMKYIAALLNHKVPYPAYIDLESESDILPILRTARRKLKKRRWDMK